MRLHLRCLTSHFTASVNSLVHLIIIYAPLATPVPFRRGKDAKFIGFVKCPPATPPSLSGPLGPPSSIYFDRLHHLASRSGPNDSWAYGPPRLENGVEMQVSVNAHFQAYFTLLKREGGTAAPSMHHAALCPEFDHDQSFLS